MPNRRNTQSELMGVMPLIRSAEDNSQSMGMDLSTGHLLLSMLQQRVEYVSEYLESIGLNDSFVIENIPQFHESPEEFDRLIQLSVEKAPTLNEIQVTPRVLFFVMIIDSRCVAYNIVRASGADIVNMRRDIVSRVSVSARSARQPGERTGPKGTPLQRFGSDLTQLAKENKLDPVVGRENEMERVLSILGRKTKNNPALIGEAGVGKTAIVEGIAQRIVRGDIPEQFKGKRIVAISLSKLTAGTRMRGDFEENVQKLVDEIKNSPDVIVFLDELHTLVGAGSAQGGLDASNILKPELAKGELRCIGSTTMDEYRKYIEKDAALERRFQPIKVDPPSVEETIEILKGLRQRYEEFHGVTYTDEALREAVFLSDRYISDRHLPDKAIDLIDEVGGWAKGHNVQNITSKEIAQILKEITGIEVLTTQQRKERLQKCEDELNKRILGNPRFCRVMHEIVNGMFDPRRPKTVVFLAGSTGLGKTYAVTEFHKFMFGDEKKLVRLDMSEFSEQHTVSRLIGSPPGYVGYEEAGQLTEKVRRNPSTTFLLDEIDRAHKDVHEMLFQVFEDGLLTDAQGRTVRFNETYIFMTSNLPVDLEGARGRLGFSSRKDSTETPSVEDAIKEAMRKAGFEDPFINRIDHFIFFTPFERDVLVKMVDLMVGDMLKNQLKERELKLELTDDAKKFLVDKGYNAELGAKELRRTLRSQLMAPLGKVIDNFNKGDTIVVKVKEIGDGLEFST